MHQLLLATRNAHKTREFAEVLGAEFLVRDLGGVDLPAVVENGRTFAENAALKAMALSKAIPNELVVADDSGLEVDALSGAPGVYSARFAGEGATDQDRISKLLREIAGESNRAARFCCALAVARGGKMIATFVGEIAGRILETERGAAGFGYDPIFVPDGFDRTFAELGEIKNQISHRARAIRALREFFKNESRLAR